MLENYIENNFVLRTPLLPFSEVNSFLVNFDEEELVKKFEKENLMHALFIASPVLFSEVQKASDRNKFNEKILSSLLKYYIRSSTRCTPFGLFAGLSVGRVLDSDNSFKISSKFITSFRLNMDYLTNIYISLSKDEELIPQLTYFANSSISKVGKKLRYVETYIENNVQLYRLVKIDNNSVLSKILKYAHTGISFRDCIGMMEKMNLERDVSINYLKELIESQVLISELYPNITGEKYQEVLFKKLSSFNKYRNIFYEISSLLNSNLPPIELANLMKDKLSKYFQITINQNAFLHVDSYRDPIDLVISKSIVDRIKDASFVVSCLNSYNDSSIYLERFKKAFYERYEEAEVPLLEVLDTDIGLSYVNSIVGFPNHINMNNINDNNEQAKFKLNLYTRALRENLTEISVTDEDIRVLKGFKEESSPLPDSVVFRGEIFQNQNNTIQLIWRGLFNNATAALGRFGHLSDSIKNLCRDITKLEEAVQPDKIFAEIAHNSEGVVGNILIRPHYRQYEIPYLSQSTLPAQNQIWVDELMISIKDGRFVLRSKKLNKVIVPRMANAHNYARTALPVYHFLCDLQFDSIRAYLGWDWGPLEGVSFLPRVLYKDFILSEATWNVNTEELNQMRMLSSEDKIARFFDFKLKYKIDNLVFLINGEDRLLLNLKLPICLDILLNAAKNTEQLKLTECLCNNESMIVEDELGNGYTNELLIPFNKVNSDYSISNRNIINESKMHSFNPIQRKFAPFSEWVYFKIYSGPKAINTILIDNIFFLTSKLLNGNIISKWFFIRYADPHNHLRIRFRLKSGSEHNQLYEHVKRIFEPLIRQKFIWKIQVDTYDRELERYGNNNIELCESFFFINSKFTLDILRILNNDNTKNTRLLIGIFSVIKILDAFKYSLIEKVIFIKEGTESFVSEFNLETNKEIRMGVNKLFRDIVPELDFLCGIRTNYENRELIDQISIKIDEQTRKLNIINISLRKINSKKRMDDLMRSFIHMFINRFFSLEQRYEEMRVYIILHKYYNSYKVKILDDRNQ